MALAWRNPPEYAGAIEHFRCESHLADVCPDLLSAWDTAAHMLYVLDDPLLHTRQSHGMLQFGGISGNRRHASIGPPMHAFVQAFI